MTSQSDGQVQFLLPPNPPSTPTLLGIPEDCRRIIYDHLFRECWLLVKWNEYPLRGKKRHEDPSGYGSDSRLSKSRRYHLSFKSPHVHISLLYTCKTIYQEARLVPFEHLLLAIDTVYTIDRILETIGSHVLRNIKWVQLIGRKWDWSWMQQMPKLRRLELGGNRDYKRKDLSSQLILHTKDQDGLDAFDEEALLERFAEEWPKCHVGASGDGYWDVPNHPLRNPPKGNLPYELNINFRVAVTVHRTERRIAVEHSDSDSESDLDAEEEEWEPVSDDEESDDRYDYRNFEDTEEAHLLVNWNRWEAPGFMSRIDWNSPWTPFH